MTRPVFLLKSPSRLVDDPFRKSLVAEGYHPIFIEVLESVLSNRKKVEDIISSDPRGVYSAVVITSSRAAEAWQAALINIANCGNWSDIPFYVVGESTAHVLKPMTTSHPTKFSRHLILGAHAGNAELLAQFILNDLPARRTVGRLLYLTGSKNRDTFYRIMAEHDVSTESLMVYETGVSSNLENRIGCAVEEADNKYQKHADFVWIGFFAPSSSDFALPYLRKYFSLPQLDINSDEGAMQGRTLRYARLAAIGATTSEFLTTQAYLRVDAMPLKPSAEHFVRCIKSFEEKQSDVLT